MNQQPELDESSLERLMLAAAASCVAAMFHLLLLNLLG